MQFVDRSQRLRCLSAFVITLSVAVHIGEYGVQPHLQKSVKFAPNRAYRSRDRQSNGAQIMEQVQACGPPSGCAIP